VSTVERLRNIGEVDRMKKITINQLILLVLITFQTTAEESRFFESVRELDQGMAFLPVKPDPKAIKNMIEKVIDERIQSSFLSYTYYFRTPADIKSSGYAFEVDHSSLNEGEGELRTLNVYRQFDIHSVNVIEVSCREFLPHKTIYNGTCVKYTIDWEHGFAKEDFASDADVSLLLSALSAQSKDLNMQHNRPGYKEFYVK